ncbi:hypothetical protein P4O66_002017 [Electrophorus voltai]|uniref:Podocin n=1 Tax=Electrophorus voltai TaxID=2609070 RepID=A0AAD9E3G2_9TELE|nr:hypothetical protein P4O66_002017 [Electrophorus voltai]
MFLMEKSEMERRTKLVLPAHLPRPVRTKRDTPAAARERRHRGHRSVKVQEAPRRKDRVRSEKTGHEDTARDKPGASGSTVINVDSVREKTREEDEELLGLLQSDEDEALKPHSFGVCELLLIVAALTAVIFFFPVSLWFCVKVVTKDLVCTEVSAVCYYRIENACVCCSSVAGVTEELQALVQVSIREVLAHHSFTHILQNRSTLAQEIQVVLDSIACRWGIKVEAAHMEDVQLPPELQHNFAVEAEAKRQAQIRLIAAEGEKAACEVLRASVDTLSSSPLAVQLRLLQLLHTLRSDQPAVLLNLPSDLLSQPLQLSTTASSTNQNCPVDDTSQETAKDSPMM